MGAYFGLAACRRTTPDRLYNRFHCEFVVYTGKDNASVNRLDRPVNDEPVAVTDFGSNHRIPLNLEQERRGWIQDEDFVKVDAFLCVVLCRAGEFSRHLPKHSNER